MRPMLEPIYTREQAREHFAGRLTYDDINSANIGALVLMLDAEYARSNAAGETSVNTMRVSHGTRMKLKKDGSVKECFIFVDSHYFKKRECISFYEDGFIGFAYWADDGNTNPITRAFVKWCDELAAEVRAK